MNSGIKLLIEKPLSEAELLAVTGEAEQRMVAAFATESRRREALMWRYIVRRELGADVEICYNELGAPQVTNREVCIGVSHSADFVAVIIAPVLCAVDIERLDRNFERVSSRYITSDERMLSCDERLPAILWCAKEALYKFSGEKGVDFLRDLRILEVDAENGFAVGQIRDGHPIKMNVKFHSDNVVVYIA